MRARRERRVELPDCRQDGAGLDDRVDAEVRPRAVRRAAADLDLRPHEPLVGDDDLQLGGLGHDRRVGVDHLEDFLHSDARVLLVGDRRNQHVAGEVVARRVATGHECCGEPGLHVVGATSVEAIAVDARHVRIAHALDRDRVEVAAQQQRAAAAGAAGTHDDARAPGRPLQHRRLEPGVPRPRRHERSALAFAGASRDERRVDRVDRYQP